MHMDDERPMKDSKDEPVDDSLRELVARGYHAPHGEVPREEMWSRIAAARRVARTTSVTAPNRVDHSGTPVIPLHRRPRTIWRWSAALAAGLVLGIAVDRALVRRGETPATRVSDGARGSVPTSSNPSAPQSESASVAEPSTPDAQNDGAPSARGDTRSGVQSVPSHVATTSGGAPDRSTGTRAQLEPTSPDPSDLYRAAAMQTLVQAEALLTAYRTTGDAAPDPQAMQQAARWARDVLSSTRLLMDSPAARDPRMRVLFSDLELVLAQIVQLSGAPLQAPERELIERALRDRDLLPRLRSAVPAGLTTS
jgi:hypothetical protein